MDVALMSAPLASAFCFALALVLAQFGLRTINPITGAMVALPTTALLFLIISPKTVQWNEWNGQGAMIFAAVGLVFPIAVTILTFTSNRLIGPNLTGTLGNLTPLFAVALAILLLGETPNNAQSVGIFTICVGITFLFFNRPIKFGRLALVALVLPIVAAMLRGIAQPLVKLGLVEWADPYAAVTIGYVISAIVIGGFMLTRWNYGTVANRADLAWFAAVGIVNGAAVLFLYMALEESPVTIVAPLVACYPLLTLVFNRVLLKENHLSRFTLLGIILSVTGVILLLRS